jgi:hypothetical protein
MAKRLTLTTVAHHEGYWGIATGGCFSNLSISVTLMVRCGAQRSLEPC